MTLNEIVSGAASVYPDGWVTQYWDANRQCAVHNRNGGDSLAEFVAWELYETLDPDAGDDEQLDTAIRKMRQAAGELEAVADALAGLKQERAA